MNDLSKETRTPLWTLLVLAFAACSPAPTPRLNPSPSAEPTHTKPPMTARTLTPTPGTTATPTPWVPTSSPAPSVAPNSSPTPAPFPVDSVTFRSIQMMDLKTGWASAYLESEEETRIFHTADGGVTWLDVSPVETYSLGSFFLDGQVAWVWAGNGGPAWRSLDGGASWTLMGEFGWQSDLGFTDRQHGWDLKAEYWGLSFVQVDIISFSTTQDGGQTWQETNPPPNRGSVFMAYPSAQMAWAVRAGFAKSIGGVPNLGVPFHVQTTFDGGGTWTTRQMPLPPEATRLERPYEGTYFSGFGNCDFVSPVYSSTAIWKLALTCEGGSWMYTSANQGKTWIISDMPAGLDADIEFIDPSNGWLLIGDPYESSEGHLYRTTNGGQSWSLIKRTGWTDARLSFVDTQTGWAVACADAYCYQRKVQQTLIKTSDGGQTWQKVEPEFSR